MTAGATRAERNRNPGNIRIGDPWQGLLPFDDMTDAQKSEVDFCVFSSPKWGFRAMARVLIMYQDKYDCRQIARIIAKWAPPSENDTGAYVRHVCSLTGFNPDEVLDLHKYADLAPLVKAIATHESGGWLFDDRDLDSGLTLAGVPRETTETIGVHNSRTMQGAAAGGAATAAIAAAQVIEQVQPAVSVLREFATIGPWVAVVVLIAALAYVVYARRDDFFRNVR